jgi:hypothetical protein
MRLPVVATNTAFHQVDETEQAILRVLREVGTSPQDPKRRHFLSS